MATKRNDSFNWCRDIQVNDFVLIAAGSSFSCCNVVVEARLFFYLPCHIKIRLCVCTFLVF